MSVHHKWSLITLCLAALSLLYITTIYYPRYERTGVNGTLSYDVGGYYLYLPATFIYKDLKYFSFQDTLKSDPINVTTYQGKFHDNGGFTIKYPAGMAIQYLPFFTVAHIWACNSKVHASNGYSFPYQTMIYFGSVLIAFIGLFYLRKVLLLHFSDSITSLTLASIFFGSNYMAYASINAAMSHNYLFTINAILLYKISNYYKTPILQQAVYMGFLIGLAALTRPTEIITALIAVFWGINILSGKELKKRVQWIRRYKNHYIAAITMAFAVGSIQFIYWYYVTGNPIVFSYSNDDGFDFLSPHIWKCLFSVKAGWLLYSPIMFFTLAGFYILYQKDKSLFCSIFLYFILFTYVTFSWNNWWYGGSLGQRAMVQSYPFLAFPMAYFYGYIRCKSKAIICITTFLFLLFIYMNIWATHMSHNGKLFLTPPHLSTAYFKKVVGTWKQNNNDLKLLDTDEEYLDEIIKPLVILDQFSDDDPLIINPHNPDFKTEPFYPDPNAEWLRTSVTAFTSELEYYNWKQTQLIVSFIKDDYKVKSNFIRLQRHLKPSVEKEIYIDVSIPDKAYDYAQVSILLEGSKKHIIFRNLTVTSFEESR